MKTEKEIIELREKLLKAKRTLSKTSNNLYSDDMLNCALMTLNLVLEDKVGELKTQEK